MYRRERPSTRCQVSDRHRPKPLIDKPLNKPVCFPVYLASHNRNRPHRASRHPLPVTHHNHDDNDDYNDAYPSHILAYLPPRSHPTPATYPPRSCSGSRSPLMTSSFTSDPSSPTPLTRWPTTPNSNHPDRPSIPHNKRGSKTYPGLPSCVAGLFIVNQQNTVSMLEPSRGRSSGQSFETAARHFISGELGWSLV